MVTNISDSSDKEIVDFHLVWHQAFKTELIFFSKSMYQNIWQPSGIGCECWAGIHNCFTNTWHWTAACMLGICQSSFIWGHVVILIILGLQPIKLRRATRQQNVNMHFGDIYCIHTLMRTCIFSLMGTIYIC